MAYKSIVYPPSLVALGNEIPLSITVIDAYVSKGEYQRGIIRFMTYHEAGDRIEFSFSDETIVFTCVNNYNGQANTYPSHTSESLFEWGIKVFNAFRTSIRLMDKYVLSYNYAIYGSIFTIYLDPYERIPSNNCEIDIYTSGQAVSYPVNCPADELYENYNLQIQLFHEYYFQSSLIQTKLRSPVIIPFIYNGYNAGLYYNLQRLVYEEPAQYYKYPADTIFRHMNIMKKYFLQLTFEGDNIAAETIFRSNYFYTLPGRLSLTKEKTLNTESSDLFKLLSATKQFLTFAPLIKYTDIYAPERLSFLFFNAGTYFLKVKEYYADKSSDTRTLSSFSVSSWSIYEFAVSFQDIKLETYTSKPVKYDIWIENISEELISDIRTFILDFTYQPSARYFHFLNSLGVFELFRSTGDCTKNAAVEKQYYDKYITRPTHKDHIKKQFDYQASLSCKINSGYLESSWNFYFASEFLVSPKVFQLKKGAYYAGIVSPASFEICKSGFDTLHEFDFTWILDDISDDLYEDFQLSLEPPIGGDFNFDFNDDFNI